MAAAATDLKLSACFNIIASPWDLDNGLQAIWKEEFVMKNQTHPEFRGSRRSRKDPLSGSMKSKEVLKKGHGKRPQTSTSAPHSKFFGH
jgi:hypothetical protein